MPHSFDNKFENLIEKSPVATAVLEGPEMRLVIANEAALQIWGKDRSIIGKELLGFLPELQGQPFPDLLKRVYTSGETYTEKEALAYISLNNKLKPIYFDFAYTPLKNPEGKTHRILITAVDVTSQVEARMAAEKSEQRLSLAVQSAQMGTWEFYPQTLMLKFSERTRELSGFTADEDVTLEKTLARVHPDDRTYVREAIAAALDPNKEGNFDAAYRVVLANKKEIWVHSKGKTFFNEEKAAYFTTGIIIDITESKLSELRKNDFIAMVSHELKTPLTSVKSYLQIALRRILKSADNVSLNALKRAEKQADKMARLIQGFLDINSLEAGKTKLNHQNFSLEELFKEVISYASILSPEHQFDVHICENCSIFADKDKISQVLFNLLTNAIKYSPAGSTIRINTERDNGILKISVIDRGIGISEKDVPNLFQRFYRVDSERVKMASGFGIGLYISQEIIKLHNGCMGVQSKEGLGSTFWFQIPA
ncbi:ATP-binding protein [Rubrolithibacter danxiaensis]|uniref:ATP-binding protein n=1 Tax=Rubrolithibacter danxiaensis TaxID=3390805 RepID=UPI003BF83FC2